ncbi:MAG: hypothetical protein GY760_17000 [Deltaproteobacteria bacterium]|nr:hypothetical protein [Deltaproteobacteria bacterium]
MIEINLKIDGQDQFKKYLAATTKNITNLTPFWNKTLDLAEQRIDEVFENEGSNIENAQKWPKLSPKTIKARKRGWGYYGKVPRNNKSIDQALRWSGKLQDDRKRQTSTNRAILTMNAPYSLWHQRGNKNLPQRLVIDFSNKIKNEIVRIMQKMVVESNYSRTNL